MSAIAGIMQTNHEPLASELGVKMMKSLERYPADRSLAWHGEELFLGCHAQWITPEAARETLPFYDSERELAITADAIIDNRAELCGKLGIPASQRDETTDSELILLAYAKWGEESPRHLIGDFAYVIWDRARRSLFGARDFTGNRTLYFARGKAYFAFCTTMRPLLALPGVGTELDEMWLAEFLAIHITADAVDSYSTVYSGIRQLPPAHSMTVSGDRIAFRQYVTLESGEQLRLKSDGEYEEAFRDVFTTAISDRTRTRGEVGAHLSGGLDSGSVAGFAAARLRGENRRLHTFSYYPLEDFSDWTPRSRVADERPLIRSTVAHVGNIEPHYLNFPGMSPLTEVDDWLDTLEMPYKFFENSFWLKGIYRQAGEAGVGVLLNGQRGNWTVSWGPAIDYQANLLRRFRLFRFYREFGSYCGSMGVKRSRVFPDIGKKAFPLVGRLFTREDYRLPTLINPRFARETRVFEKLRSQGMNDWGSPLHNAYDVRKDQFKQLYFWTINGTIGTKLSLKHALWDRDPTNDLRVVRFCLAVPDEQFVHRGMDRAMIRRATEGVLPDDIRLNRRTRGVQGADGVHRMAPAWDGFVAELEGVLTDPVASGYLNTERLAEALAKIRKEPRPEYIFDFDFRILMRGLIFTRFMRGVR